MGRGRGQLEAYLNRVGQLEAHLLELEQAELAVKDSGEALGAYHAARDGAQELGGLFREHPPFLLDNA